MQAFLPLLGTDLTLKGNPGKILNMSSIYGSYTLPFSVSPINLISCLLHGMSSFEGGMIMAILMV